MKANIDGRWVEVKERRIVKDGIVDWLRATWEVWRVPIGYFAAAFLGGLFVWGVAR